MWLVIQSAVGSLSKLRRHTAIFAFAALTVAMATTAEAQQRSRQRSYEPATPTMSPYIGLLQSNSGPIPNYFSLVRPRVDQQQFNSQVRATERIRSLQIQQLSRGAARNEEALETGNQAGFMQFLHYYPAPRSVGRGR
ncbi:hypothetical protein FF011L_48690 [Roseimaritima multifibrata]|uniref:Uncharacterized protein n=1 Tax=Roseimaritima multifibrata TaxID=1930274 RepID=A0A517MMF0_9BACT|nr:hypothetical protein [Roseimaritima multifibrata]QDS96065.1 hypothetical protein FF011L_48690 [Roseimaritima multifibrata]